MIRVHEKSVNQYLPKLKSNEIDFRNNQIHLTSVGKNNRTQITSYLQKPKEIQLEYVGKSYVV